MTSYQTHPEYLAQLAGIIELPADDLRRLVLADWLDERGESERAEFIRVQVQIDSWGCSFRQTPEQPGWKHNCGTDEKGYWLCQPLRSLGQELLEEHGSDWCPVPISERGARPDHEVWTGHGVAFVFRRGFVAGVRCRLADWIGGECGRCSGDGDLYYAEPGADEDADCPACHGEGRTPGIGPAVLAAHPLDRVEVTDRESQEGQFDNGRFYWVSDDRVTPNADELRFRVPYGLILLMYRHLGDDPDGRTWIEFISRSAALDALSAALIAWAMASR